MLCFICLLGPFAFFDVSKTKLLQLFTSALRWTSFISMIVLSIIRIAGGHHVTPVGANFAQVPNLFGVAVYSFMCQHSLPGNPGRFSSRIKIIFSADNSDKRQESCYEDVDGWFLRCFIILSFTFHNGGILLWCYSYSRYIYAQLFTWL